MYIYSCIYVFFVLCTYTCIHTCIHTYMRTYRLSLTCMHACIHTDTHHAQQTHTHTQGTYLYMNVTVRFGFGFYYSHRAGSVHVRFRFLRFLSLFGSFGPVLRPRIIGWHSVLWSLSFGYLFFYWCYFLFWVSCQRTHFCFFRTLEKANLDWWASKRTAEKGLLWQ